MLRRGATLAELLVALVIGAIVLGAATTSLVRQQRSTTAMVTGGRSGAQVRMATGLFTAQLALHDATDLVPSELRDSTVQVRAGVAHGTACATSTVASLAVGGDDLSSGGITAPVRGGDTLWWYHALDDVWTGRAVAAATTSPGACGAAGNGGVAGATVHLQLSGEDTIPVYAPLRITRTERLVVYRAGDGTYQLGLREWSEGAGAPGSPQPAAGPFIRSAAGARTGFRYFDAAGAELHPSTTPGGAVVARVRLTALAAPQVGMVVRDSADVAIRPPGAP